MDHTTFSVLDNTETLPDGARQVEVHAGRVWERGDAQQETFFPPVNHTPDQFLQQLPTVCPPTWA